MGEAEARIGLGDTDEFVILGNALGARKGTGFNLTGAETDGEVGD